MMGPEDIGERRQANHTPTIALSIAAILLLIVGALSYRDFVRTSLEKEFAEKEARLMQRQGFYGEVSPGQVATGSPAPSQPNSPGVSQGIPQSGNQGAAGRFPTQEPGTIVAYDAQGNPVTASGQAAYQQSSELQYQSTLPVPNDPEISNIRDSLDQAREQSRLTEQRYNQLAGNVDTQAREAEQATTTGETQITSELPDFLRNAVENPPGGNPEVEERLERMRKQVAESPSLGKVTSYDKDWGVVTFDAGAGQGVKVAQRFAVRRGSDILGWIKVDQVEEDHSIAVLVTKNRESDTSVKPEIGDDLIDFELF